MSVIFIGIEDFLPLNRRIFAKVLELSNHKTKELCVIIRINKAEIKSQAETVEKEEKEALENANTNLEVLEKLGHVIKDRHCI